MAWYRNPAKPTWDMIGRIKPTEWLAIENDDASNVYLTGMIALNLPTGPRGDWHGALWLPVAGSRQSTRTKANEGFCQVGNRLWRGKELVDARSALRAIGHPRGNDPTPVWAASHVRAVAEMVMSALLGMGRIDNPDVHSARRWLTSEQREQAARMLEEAKSELATEAQRSRLDAWKTALCARTGLVPADDAQ